jgi:hypothetical protein
MASTTSRPSALRASRELRANQNPRIRSVPDYGHSAGDEAIELAALAGLILDPWQQLVLRDALGEGVGGKWAAFQVAVVVPRQNGKGGILEARELAGLFLFGDRLIIHSAHQFDTSIEAFLRMDELIAGTPELAKRVKAVHRSHGHEGFTLKNGQRLRYRARTSAGGRGFSCDCLVLDEAMDLQEKIIAALIPTLSSKPKPQVWYAASAVDQLSQENGHVLARLRDKGIKGEEERLAYFEWSVDAPNPADVPPELLRDEAAWAAANPAFGIRISPEYIADERSALGSREFAVERLGIGDWPALDGIGSVIPLDKWDKLIVEPAPENQMVDPVCFALDVSPERTTSAISVAGRRPDGNFHTEVMEHRAGTGWVVPWLVERVEKHQPLGVICDRKSPANSLVPELTEAGIEVIAVTAEEHAQACGIFFDAVDQEKLRHLGTTELRTALRGAAKRPLGDAWAWARKTSGVDITPLVASTLAVYGVATLAPEEEEIGFAVISLP